MFTHSVYDNIRTRVIVLHEGRVLMHDPRHLGDELPYRLLPGGGLEPNETLYEAGEREVLEETGLRVDVTSVAFLREHVIPRFVPAGETAKQAEEWGFEVPPDDLPDYGYSLEIYLWAELRGDPEAVKPDDLRGLTPEWVPLERLEEEPLFPAELRALARDLLAGRRFTGVPSFPGRLGSPSDRPDYDVFESIRAGLSED